MMMNKKEKIKIIKADYLSGTLKKISGGGCVYPMNIKEGVKIK